MHRREQNIHLILTVKALPASGSSRECSAVNMLSRFPHEVRLKIFHFVFDFDVATVSLSSRKVMRVEETPEGFTYRFTHEDDERCYAGAIFCTNAAIVGEGVAAAAAEALYKSHMIFAVDAKLLCSFMQSCPLSHSVEPGRYIRNLHIYKDADPLIIGDGEHGHQDQLIRHCWRAILNMPKLGQFESWIKLSKSRFSPHHIKRTEIRHIIPTNYRPIRIRAHTSIRLRAWELHDHPPDRYERLLYELVEVSHVDDDDDDGFDEPYADFSTCNPYRWGNPEDQRVLNDDFVPWTSLQNAGLC